ncbi:sugar transferase [Stieleria sp. TO1_6]|uniref:sugar transferase n=1 Tax=Stieleria tagensis TaxID=2956795 RepID=UPI00209B66B2|nr:sugar transferase [Stieleria tagensis]MCO8120691.1 sugar transferase [Stieleria tagensis]
MSVDVTDRRQQGGAVSEAVSVAGGSITLPGDRSSVIVGDSYGSIFDLLACPAVHSPVYRMMKRVTDVVGSIVGIIVLSPIFLLAAIAVLLKDGRPIIFRQTRVGLNGSEFTIYKFRTMTRNAEQQLDALREQNEHGDSVTFKMRNDPRVIPIIGQFMRRTSIDELPQLWNVLRGEMSLVGPRPALPKEVARYDAPHMVRLAAKPGLTCFWQVSGRGELGFDQQFELDCRYVAECSFIVDLWLIAMTFPALIKARGAC